MPFGQPQRITNTPGNDAGQPTIAAAGDNVYIVWHELVAAGSGPEIFFSRSADRGATFSAPINLSNTAPTASGGEDLAVSGSAVFVVWSTGPDVIKMRRSTDAGASFEPARSLSHVGGADRPQVYASRHHVYVAWQAGGPNQDIYFSQSSDSGVTFSGDVNISNSNMHSDAPQILVTENRVVATWRDQSTPNQEFDIFYAHT